MAKVVLPGIAKHENVIDIVCNTLSISLWKVAVAPCMPKGISEII